MTKEPKRHEFIPPNQRCERQGPTGFCLVDCHDDFRAFRENRDRSVAGQNPFEGQDNMMDNRDFSKLPAA